MKKIKASDLEKQWNEDLIKRGVLSPNKNIEGWKEECEKGLELIKEEEL